MPFACSPAKLRAAQTPAAQLQSKPEPAKWQHTDTGCTSCSVDAEVEYHAGNVMQTVKEIKNESALNEKK